MKQEKNISRIRGCWINFRNVAIISCYAIEYCDWDLEQMEELKKKKPHPARIGDGRGVGRVT